MCFSIENFIIYTLLVGDIYTELKINEVRCKICDDLSFTFGYVRLFFWSFMYYKYNFITREEEIFGKYYAILCFDCSSDNISYSDDDSSTEYSSDSDDE